MLAYLDFVVKGLVSHPDDVKINPLSRDGGIMFELRMHPDDVGKIIGKQGATIGAIRSLLQVGSARKGLRCSLEIVEDQPRH